MNVAPNPGGANRDISLQALRGIAACCVLVYHAAHFTAIRTGAPWLEELFISRFGFYGVLVFFVLSGFLMESAIRRYDAKTFALHRFARLYPTYWLICACFFLAKSVRAGAWVEIPWKTLTLLPLGEMSRPLGVEWTLLYEVFFYMVCTLLCVWRRAHLPVMVVWLFVVAIAVFFYRQFGTTMQPTFAEIPFSAMNVAFICGGLAGHLNRRLTTLDPGALWLGGLALIMLAKLAATGPDMFLTAPGITCVILALVRGHRADARPPGVFMRALFLLGECSYGIYLAHVLTVQVVLQYVPADGWSLPGAVFVGVTFAGLTVGLLAGGVDVMLYRSLKAWIDRRVRRHAPAGDAANVLQGARVEVPSSEAGKPG
jgi:exopolysaccharide production protein ExoZ